jgi:hypothetical protein
MAYDRAVRAAVLVLLASCSFEHGRVPGGTVDDGGIDAPDDGNGGGSDTGGGSGSDSGSNTSSTLRQKTITITGAVTGTLTDFPLWVSMTDADLAADARSDGTDIHFVTGNSATPLDFQIQSFTKSTGRLDAWVRVPSLATGSELALRYGDVTMAHAPDAPGTFAGYAAVWHLDDPLTNNTIVDARALRNGTAAMLGPSESVAAWLGRGISFKGGADQITFTNPLTGTTPHTISLWINQRATANNDAIIALGNATPNQARWFHSRYEAATIAVGLYANDFTNVNDDVIGDGWVLLHWVFEGTNRMSRIYRGGVQIAGPFQHNAGINTQGTGGVLGNAPGGFGADMGINATLDEVRIINVARSAAWIAAEAANQGPGSTFYSVSAEQMP